MAPAVKVDDEFKQRADALYAKCSEKPAETLFYQTDLTGLNIAQNVQDLNHLIEHLTENGLLQLLQSSEGSICWKVRSKEDASKRSKLKREENMIYQEIEVSGTTGVWTRTIQKKTNLHQQVVTRCLKALEQAKYIKQIKSVKYPSRKIYMLFELEPTEEVTGGPWYSDGELDVEFINLISDIICKYVEQNSWHQGPRLPGWGKRDADNNLIPPRRVGRWAPPINHETGRILVPKDPYVQEYPTSSSILTFIESANILSTGKELSPPDLTHLLEMLVFDGRLERMGRRMASKAEPKVDVEMDDEVGVQVEEMYRTSARPAGEDAEFGPGNGFSETPCSKCPVFRLCEDGGPVNAANCAYLTDWLK